MVQECLKNKETILKTRKWFSIPLGCWACVCASVCDVWGLYMPVHVWGDQSQCGVTIALHFLLWDRASQWSWWLLFQLYQGPGSTGNLPSSPAQGLQAWDIMPNFLHVCSEYYSVHQTWAANTCPIYPDFHPTLFLQKVFKTPAFKCLESTPKLILSLTIHFSHYSEFISKAHVEDCGRQT